MGVYTDHTVRDSKFMVLRVGVFYFSCMNKIFAGGFSLQAHSTTFLLIKKMRFLGANFRKRISKKGHFALHIALLTFPFTSSINVA